MLDPTGRRQACLQCTTSRRLQAWSSPEPPLLLPAVEVQIGPMKSPSFFVTLGTRAGLGSRCRQERPNFNDLLQIQRLDPSVVAWNSTSSRDSVQIPNRSRRSEHPNDLRDISLFCPSSHFCPQNTPMGGTEARRRGVKEDGELRTPTAGS